MAEAGIAAQSSVFSGRSGNKRSYGCTDQGTVRLKTSQDARNTFLLPLHSNGERLDMGDDIAAAKDRNGSRAFSMGSESGRSG